ncbi:MAG TPA: NusG domain II-containing protein, partial [Lachnospiraceae bacterium]|nr:NusG domain II-containing protein [Lachnospiraceae bacterium]
TIIRFDKPLERRFILLKRNDIILIGSLLIVAVIFLAVIALTKEKGSYAIVMVDGKEVERLSLAQDREVQIKGYHNGTNTLVIENGSVYMKEASCPDQYCVNHTRIHYSKESIVCLPNRVVIEIASDEKQDLDSIVN